MIVFSLTIMSVTTKPFATSITFLKTKIIFFFQSHVLFKNVNHSQNHRLQASIIRFTVKHYNLRALMLFHRLPCGKFSMHCLKEEQW